MGKHFLITRRSGANDKATPADTKEVLSVFPMHCYLVLLLVLIASSAGHATNINVPAMKTINVLHYGATGDGSTDDTAALDAAYAACRAADGAVVLFPSGHIFITRPLKLACNNSVTNIEAGAVLRAKPDTDSWPFGPDSPEPSQGRTGRQMAPLLHIHEGSNMTLTGGGTVDGQGELFWAQSCGNWWCPNGYPHDQPKAFRPFLLRIDYSTQIVVENIHMVNPGFWNLVPFHSHHVLISKVNVSARWSQGARKSNPFRTPNTDGFEPMWSTHVTVRGCSVRNGDDCMTVKSGSSNVLVEDLYCEHGDGLTIGSVWYDDITNVTYRRVVMNNTHNGPMIKGRSQGNATVSNVLFEDVTLIGVYLGLTVDCVYETEGSVQRNIGVQARNITFRNIHGTVTGGAGGGGGSRGDPSMIVDSAGSFICLPARPCSVKLIGIAISQLNPVLNTSAPEWLCNHTQIEASSVNPPLTNACI